MREKECVSNGREKQLDKKATGTTVYVVLCTYVVLVLTLVQKRMEHSYPHTIVANEEEFQ
jgi:hypothetical protein